ncbi:MAG: DUF4258 domain-containing protein [Phycisphaerae bacterium]|nr:DUF4258 domain-containing protein [Phycisphaerae bacterium]
MNTPARHALNIIRRCIARDRVRLTMHFRVRLTERGVLWADVLALFDAPSGAESDGVDDAGRARWIVRGASADGARMGVVCAVGRDESGELTVFVTAFWED